MMSVTGLAIAIPLVLAGPLISSHPIEMLNVAPHPTSANVTALDTKLTQAEHLDTSNTLNMHDKFPASSTDSDKIQRTIHINSHGQRVHLLHF